MPEYKKYEEMIGGTPMINLNSMLSDEAQARGVVLLGKAEFLNPGFSQKVNARRHSMLISSAQPAALSFFRFRAVRSPPARPQDRIAREILDQAAASGALQPGGTVIAASSGNTGAATAMMGAMRGYKVIIVTNSKCSQEKMDSITAYGAELIVVEDGVDYMDFANEYAAEHGIYDIDQYDNLANSAAHEKTLAPELLADTDGTITHFVAGGSTGGTLSGVGRGIKAVKPDVQIVLADPVGSVFAPMFETGELVEQGKFLVEGVGKGNIPGNMDFTVVDSSIVITDDESFSTCHLLAQSEGILVGGSAGLNVCAAKKVAEDAPDGSVVVTLLCDNGVKYLSKVYNDEYLTDNSLSAVADLSVLATQSAKL